MREKPHTPFDSSNLYKRRLPDRRAVTTRSIFPIFTLPFGLYVSGYVRGSGTVKNLVLSHGYLGFFPGELGRSRVTVKDEGKKNSNSLPSVETETEDERKRETGREGNGETEERARRRR